MPPETAANDAVADLLGVLACGELAGFEQLARDADLAHGLSDKLRISALAAADLRHLELLRARMADLGIDPVIAMAPFVEPLERFHERTRPVDWLEGVVKAYVGNGIAVDVYREVARLVDDRTREVVEEVLSDTGQAEFAVERVRAAIAEDPQVEGRLALWGRRIVAEALAEAQQVLVRRPALADLVLGDGGGTGGFDLLGAGAVLQLIAQRHGDRMAALGLAA